MVPSLTLVRQFCPPDEDMAQVRGAPTPKSPSSRLKTGPWVFKTTGHNCSNPIHGGLEYKGKQEQQLKESKVKPHRTGCSLPEQVLVRDGRTEQHPCSTLCSSLQPQHSRDRDKGLSLHTWLVGRNRTKLRPQLILLLNKRTARSVGWELAALGYTHKPFIHCRGEDSLTDLPLWALSCKSAVYREKLGLPREDGAETLLP